MARSNIAHLQGMLTAIVTPFDLEGNLALAHLPALLDAQREAGIDGVVVAGTNGEGTSLSVAERKQLLESAAAHRDGLLLIAGTGAASITDAIELTRHAADIGVDAALVLPPFFYKNPSTAGLADYFRRILDSADLPILLYNIPQQTAVTITDDLIAVLHDHTNLAGIKDSTGDLASTRHYITHYPELRIFAGSDRMTRQAVAAGGAGGISGSANALPAVVTALYDAAVINDDSQETIEAEHRVNLLVDVLLRYPLIAVSKCVMAERGLPRLGVRPPLVDLSASQEAQMLAELKDAGLI